MENAVRNAGRCREMDVSRLVIERSFDARVYCMERHESVNRISFSHRRDRVVRLARDKSRSYLLKT